MRLLLTNDDGISAKGIFSLAKALEQEHEVIVVAPDNQRSACGHSITLNRPLLVKKVKLEGLKSVCYSVDGTPADCVRIAVDKLLKQGVDMVVSGINRGLNIGTDVLYSGTVSATLEAAFYNIPALAVSTDVTDKLKDYELTAEYARKTINIAKDKYLKPGVVLNLNVPQIAKDKIKGIKICKIGKGAYENYFKPEFSEEEEISFEVLDKLVVASKDDTDKYYISEGYVTITPLQYDLTNYKLMKEVEEIFGQ